MLSTNRLIIQPLTYEQLLKYAACDHSLEKELRVNKISRTISLELKEALENTILPNVADPNKNYLYSTLWTAILKTENTMIGDLCIQGEPNAAGEIEIGYGTYAAFQGQGLMTEMVSGIIAWARTQAPVKAIVASTDQSNVASCKVLQKNGFLKAGETEDSIQWRLQISQTS